MNGAFIVRPFGVKNDIDFDAVEEKLNRSGIGSSLA